MSKPIIGKDESIEEFDNWVEEFFLQNGFVIHPSAYEPFKSSNLKSVNYTPYEDLKRILCPEEYVKQIRQKYIDVD